MTAKRFEIREEDITVEYDLLYGLQTCIRKDGGELLTYMEIIDLLNQLNDENDQLKQRNQELFDDLQNKTSWLSLRGGEISILKKENEQLKKENNELKLIIQQNEFAKEEGLK